MKRPLWISPIRRFCYRSIAAITACLFALPASAQDATSHPEDKTFGVDLFEPAPGSRNYFSVEGPEIGDDMKPFVGFDFSYHHKPFTVLGCDEDGNCGDEHGVINVVENLMVVDVMGAFNFLKRFQVGLALPIIVWQRGDNYEIISGTTSTGGIAESITKNDEDPTSSTGGTIGDIRLHLKVRILGDERKDGFGLAAAIIPAFPMSAWTGQGDGYSGSGFMSLTAPRVIAGYRMGAFRVAANVAMLWQEKSHFFSAETGNSLTYGVGVGYSIIPEVEILAEIYGRKTFVSDEMKTIESAPLLFLGGGRFRAKQFLFNVGVGGGILSGVGVPQFQVVAGAAWAPEKKEAPVEETWGNPDDLDGDGIDNATDACKEKPEDFDNFEDADGCPDEDNDKDKILDGYDSCPLEAEDLDQFRDDDGCPDFDHDEDGIKEPTDKCPLRAEDFDGFEDDDGCPDEDNDQDGFKDGDEDCPDLAEDKDGFQDEDGCPDLDNDNDGVPDTTDKCPNEPETLNGFKDDDGCPDKGKTLVVVTDDKIEIKEMVQFETDSDKITGTGSFEILDIVAMVLKGNTAVRVSIEGHTDNKGNADHNRELSKRRAEAVKKYLVEKGIVADRLETVGWGPDKPIADNKKTAGRKANRRVEFMIIRPEKTAVSTDTAPTEGAPAAQPAGGGESMDFTQGEGGDAMDFTVPEQPAQPAQPPAEKQGEDSMDFTQGEQ
jgi:outer membrane protein OmpA-like peptidoglycan-associated protein